MNPPQENDYRERNQPQSTSNSRVEHEKQSITYQSNDYNRPKFRQVDTSSRGQAYQKEIDRDNSSSVKKINGYSVNDPRSQDSQPRQERGKSQQRQDNRQGDSHNQRLEQRNYEFRPQTALDDRNSKSGSNQKKYEQRPSYTQHSQLRQDSEYKKGKDTLKVEKKYDARNEIRQKPIVKEKEKRWEEFTFDPSEFQKNISVEKSMKTDKVVKTTTAKPPIAITSVKKENGNSLMIHEFNL